VVKKQTNQTRSADGVFRPGFSLIWELPQNLLGFLLYLYYRHYRKPLASPDIILNHFFVGTERSGVSLGYFVFYPVIKDQTGIRVKRSKAHEYGHALQSQWLGPLYLIAVGVPSLARILYAKIYRAICSKPWGGYFKGYPESWAERLGARYSSSF